MPIALLATGDEIIMGDTLNTNSQMIAQTLTSEGLVSGFQLSCDDEEEHIIKCIDFLRQNSQTVIITGGLGPTSDDRTRFALARLLGIKLVEHEAALNHIHMRLKKANLTMNIGNRQQAMFPPGTELLPNPNGTAMGGIVKAQNKQYILLPGPPRECLPMFQQYVLPRLHDSKKNNKQLLKWRLFGVAEGEIAHKLDSALAHLRCETGYRLDVPYVEFKVRCESSVVESVQHVINPLVSSYLIATPEAKASECLCERLSKLAEPIEIIDDATGGRLQQLLQQPDTRKNIAFHETSSAHIRFHITGLDDYWEQANAKGSCSLTIKYNNELQHASETHTIPYRNQLAIEYAAEWLCFRLLHLINQLHQGKT